MTSNDQSDEFVEFLEQLAEIAPQELSDDEMASVLATVAATYFDGDTFLELAKIFSAALRVTAEVLAGTQSGEGASTYLH